MPKQKPAWREMSLAKLAAHPDNPRRISPQNLEHLKESVRRFGMVENLVWNERTGRLVSGHQRAKALADLGKKRTMVRVVDLDEQDELALLVEMNNPHAQGEFTDGLEGVLCGLEGFEGLEGLGLDDLLELEPPPPVVDPEPAEPPKKPRTKPGDLIVMGRHRLVCGDSTDPASYDALGERWDLCLTDPPYGVGLEYDGHTDSEAALRALASAFLPLVRERCCAVVFSPGVTQQWYYPEPEWVLCWFYGGGHHRSPWGFNCWQPFLAYGKDPMLSRGLGARPDAVDLNTPANLPGIDHPCPKPVKLWEWLINRLTVDGATILDPFIGSGTTVVVAEQMGRDASGIELSPAYCDVTAKRWAELTGEKPRWKHG